MKRTSFKTLLTLLIAVSFILGILTGPLSAADPKYKNHPVPKELLEQVSKEGSKLFVYNWAEWWPQELFDNFSKEFGIKVVFDYYADSEEMVAKFKLNPKAPYDVVLGCGVGDAVRLRQMGIVKDLNYDYLPNVTAYLNDSYKNRAFDPGNKFQIPDSGYATTYAVNSTKVDIKDPQFGSWKFIFENTKYANKITMLDNLYEAIGAALKSLGYSWNSDDESELMKAKEVLLKQKARVMAYDSYPRRPLVEEEAWISQTWDGDAWLVSKDMPTKGSLKSLLPKEGTFIGANTDFIPSGSEHPAAAHLFLNYIFRTDVAVMLTKTVGYPPAHKHVMEFMPPEMKAWPGFVLSEDYLKKCDFPEERQYTGKGRDLRVKIWEALKK
ncbi:spermidine/putrescine ABC transporter substrate-binding protein [Desulfococcaceae bacterium HSG9]|nr:spermidine/putrescine ABC transporter substrate-binding protein [Desulfococcaceae bacterium HSG9]